MAAMGDDWANVESDDSVGQVEPEEQLTNEPETAGADSSDEEEEDDGFDLAQIKSASAAKSEEKPAPVKKLTGKEKKELKKKELEDLDDVFAEFGIDTSAAAPAAAKPEENPVSADTGASDDKKKRKKKKAAAKKTEPKADAQEGVKLTPEQIQEKMKAKVASMSKKGGAGNDALSLAQAAVEAEKAAKKKTKKHGDFDR